jgi:hypothetical protein
MTDTPPASFNMGEQDKQSTILLRTQTLANNELATAFDDLVPLGSGWAVDYSNCLKSFQGTTTSKKGVGRMAHEKIDVVLPRTSTSKDWDGLYAWYLTVNLPRQISSTFNQNLRETARAGASIIFEPNSDAWTKYDDFTDRIVTDKSNVSTGPANARSKLNLDYCIYDMGQQDEKTGRVTRSWPVTLSGTWFKATKLKPADEGDVEIKEDSDMSKVSLGEEETPTDHEALVRILLIAMKASKEISDAVSERNATLAAVRAAVAGSESTSSSPASAPTTRAPARSRAALLARMSTRGSSLRNTTSIDDEENTET